MTFTDCRSEAGVTVGLVDAVITCCRLLAVRDLALDPAVQEAVADLRADEDVHAVACAEQAGRKGDDDEATGVGVALEGRSGDEGEAEGPRGARGGPGRGVAVPGPDGAGGGDGPLPAGTGAPERTSAEGLTTRVSKGSVLLIRRGTQHSPSW